MHLCSAMQMFKERNVHVAGQAYDMCVDSSYGQPESMRTATLPAAYADQRRPLIQDE